MFLLGFFFYKKPFSGNASWSFCFISPCNQIFPCVVFAYFDDVTPKRSIGVYYPDMGCVYTRELFNEEKGIVDVGKKRRKNKRKRN